MSLGEGAAVFILETVDAALARGHAPLCEFAGYGTTSDAKDPVRPDLVKGVERDRPGVGDAGMAPQRDHYSMRMARRLTPTTSPKSAAIGACSAIMGGWCRCRRRSPSMATRSARAAGLELAITIQALTRTNRAAHDQFPRSRTPSARSTPFPMRRGRTRYDAAMSNSFAFGGDQRRVDRALARGAGGRWRLTCWGELEAAALGPFRVAVDPERAPRPMAARSACARREEACRSAYPAIWLTSARNSTP